MKHPYGPGRDDHADDSPIWLVFVILLPILTVTGLVILIHLL